MEEFYVAALEISSSKIIGAVGVMTPDGTLKVVAIEEEESKDSVRYGIIQNPEEVASRVGRIMERLNRHPAVAPRVIKGVFVGISGRSMRSIESKVRITFPEETDITEEMLRRLKEDATAIAVDSNVEIVDTIPRSYQVDGLDTSSPKGAVGKNISAIYDIIVGRTELRRNIMRALPERTGIHINKFVIVPLAAADIVLSDEEKRLGCMLVDFGAETTTVCIYRKGSLCYYATLPLGGRNITRDITTLSILEEKAEEIKCESGKAILRDTPSSLTLYGIKLSDVSNLVVARAEEIVANVIQQIFYAGLKEKDLPAGIICIGAGSHLNGILELLSNQSGLNARLGHLPPYIQPVEGRAKRHDAIQISALLYAGSQVKNAECLELPEQKVEEIIDEIPEPTTTEPTNQNGKKWGGFLKGMRSKITNMFAPTEDESELD